MTTYLYHQPIQSLPQLIVSSSHLDQFHFDDGYDSHLTAGRVLLREGRTGTFFIVTGWIGMRGFLTWDDVRELQAMGHEIGNHTAHHVWLGKVPHAPRMAEIAEAQDGILEQTGTTAVSFAYPYGRTEGADEAVASFGFTLTRGIREVVART